MSEKNIMTIHAKCDDRISVAFVTKTIEGQIPTGLGSGDYLTFSIDTKTGQIQNWPGEEVIREFFGLETQAEPEIIMDTVTEAAKDVNEWLRYAENNGENHTVIAYLRAFPDDFGKVPPATWHTVGVFLSNPRLIGTGILPEMLGSFLGTDLAHSVIEFATQLQKVPSISDILEGKLRKLDPAPEYSVAYSVAICLETALVDRYETLRPEEWDQQVYNAVNFLNTNCSHEYTVILLRGLIGRNLPVMDAVKEYASDLMKSLGTYLLK